MRNQAPAQAVGPGIGLALPEDPFARTEQRIDRIAAVAPDLLYFGNTATCLWTVFANVRAGRGRFLDEIDATRQWLTEQPGWTGRIGVIGFCMGGGLAMALAPGHGFASSSVNYGTIRDDAERVLASACPIVARRP